MAVVGVAEINRANILYATMIGMLRVIMQLSPQPRYVLIDGNRCPKNLPCAASAIVGGDGLSLSIAAASIIAKVTRDRLMEDLDSVHPGYGFAIHKGYGTRAHEEALLRLGPCSAHRQSFAPIRKMLCPALL